ncbi:peptide/nickel transport system substrate-binding protein [Austwickia chelonae]|uniref:Putative ABC transporter substrate-binding protein n=1 Tax=Austwickia chelonae NBRC 105200 TaxID=1184607 RepID=K6W662_9MICO|nr:ABC transporter substrate-binding protein [Austwickia chelonae]GAB77317.1 putative ABC transporter substrate-binding protein [Austwickia chelonae NBRC 105200]SEW07667.1 peptide/nickel transport system substrate-binding protein [Austwickia chelonae]
MTHKPRRVRSLAAVTVATGLIAGCSAGSSQPGPGGANGSGGNGQSLTVGMVLPPASLDFTKTDGAAIPQALLTNVYEGLVKVDQNGRIGAGLARSWRVSPDRLTYTFELRDDAKFTNGAAFTAEDVKFSVERAKKDWTTSVAKTMQMVKDVRVADPKTVQIFLNKPSNDWLFRMAATRVGAMFSRTGVGDLAKTPVGTGPYKVEKWTPGDSLVLARNKDYWGAKPHHDKVTFKYMADTSALNNAMLTGSIDVLSVVQPDAVDRFKDTEKYVTVNGTTNSEVVLSFNNARGPFADKVVRQAARAAIDRKSLIEKCWGGKGQTIGSMVPPSDPWYEDLTTIAPYDPAKAKNLLAQAKMPTVTIRLRLPAVPYAVSCGQIVKSQLEQVGFVVKLDQLEFPAWLTNVLQKSDYDASIVAHVEPRDLAQVYGNPDYYIHYRNPAVTAALEAADSGDEATQIAKMKEAARMIAEDSASDWLFLMPNLMVAKKGIAGLPENLLSESFDVTAVTRS